MSQTTEILGKPVSELISADTYIDEDGYVIGTLKNVTDYTDFSSITNQQSGHYIPLQLSNDITGLKMDLIRNGITTKEDLDFDRDIVLRIANNNAKWAIKVDGVEALSLDFSKATFE